MSRLATLIQKQAGLCPLTITVDGIFRSYEFGMDCDITCKQCKYNPPVGDWLCLD